MTRIYSSGRPIFVLLAPITVLLAGMLYFFVHAEKSAANPVVSQRISLPNYDIRLDKHAAPVLATFRAHAGKNAAEIADIRETMNRGEIDLRQQVPNLKVEYNTDLRTPEVITPDVRRGKAFLTRPATGKRSSLLRSFLTGNSALFGASVKEIAALRVAADYTNPDGELSFVELNQQLNGIPVFRGEIKTGFTKDGELIRVISNFAPGLNPSSVSTDFGDPASAAVSAIRSLNSDAEVLPLNAKLSNDLKAVFGNGDTAVTAEKIYFPTEPSVAVPAWRVLVWEPINAYYVIVDAREGRVLWRKNITEDQSQPATYSIYANPNAMINAAANPFALVPGPTSPDGLQGPAISRTPIVRIGNEPPYTFNNLGWITDGGTTTAGNAVQAGLDRDGTDGIDAGGEAVSPTRDFSFSYNPLDPNTNTGDNPTFTPQPYPGTAFQQGSLTHLFYLTNLFHDETYRLGFNEVARNFQNTNFTGQGLGGDRISAEGQDSLDVNNANFSTPADGTRGRMQMFIFNASNPDIDGSLDSSVVLHELTHGLSNRLHGNSMGLSFNDMSRAMGEGWSDFYALSLLSQATDPVDGIQAVASYATYRSGGSINNNYYGIRRFPTAIKSSLGGPNNRPHNPLTFADIDSTQMNIGDGAFAPRTSGTSDQVHNAGEIWSNMLWEIRARMIARLGWEAGNRRALQLVTDGMKLSPLSPTFISGRDAIVAAAFGSGNVEDIADVWAGFAARGLGASASIQAVGGFSTGGTGRTRVTEAFDPPNLNQSPILMVDDSTGDNDGYPEPGETVRLTIPITNSTGTTATGVIVQVTNGGTADYGTLTGAESESGQTTFTIPQATTCGGVISVSLTINSSLGPIDFTRQILVGKPAGPISNTENFDAVSIPDFPPGWTAAAIDGGINFVTSQRPVPDTLPNAVFALDPTTVGGGTDLTSPPIVVTSADASVSFRNTYNTERDWDGGVLEISIAGAPFRDIVDAGGSFTQNGYNSSLGPGTNNPIANRPAWTGTSTHYILTVAQLPSDALGKVIRLKWRFGADDNTARDGWYIDTVQLGGAAFFRNFACGLGTVTVSGTVRGPNGRGMGNTTVSITDSLGNRQNVTTSSLGIYTFGSVNRGDLYAIRVATKRYKFTIKNLTITEGLSNLDFDGQE